MNSMHSHGKFSIIILKAAPVISSVKKHLEDTVLRAGEHREGLSVELVLTLSSPNPLDIFSTTLLLTPGVLKFLN